jgi:polysaccharide transporter, PST family
MSPNVTMKTKLNFIAVFSNFFIKTIWLLCLIPFGSRYIEPKTWAVFLIFQSLAIWIQIIVEFGFNITASRELINNLENRNMIVSKVFSAKIFLSVFSIIFFLIFIYITHKEYFIMGTLSILIGVINSWIPMWYFQGILETYSILISDSASRLITFFITIYIIFGKYPIEYALLINLIVTLLISIYFNLLVILKNLVIISIQNGFLGIKNTINIASFQIFTSAYANLNIILINFLHPANTIIAYLTMEKVIRASTAVFLPLNFIFTPKVIQMRKGKVIALKKLLSDIRLFYLSISIIFIVFFVALKNQISNLLHISNIPDLYVILLSVMLIPISINNFLTFGVLLPNQKDKVFANTYIILSILALPAIYISVKFLGIIGNPLILLIIELSATIILSLIVSRIKYEENTEFN